MAWRRRNRTGATRGHASRESRRTSSRTSVGARPRLAGGLSRCRRRRQLQVRTSVGAASYLLQRRRRRWVGAARGTCRVPARGTTPRRRQMLRDLPKRREAQAGSRRRHRSSREDRHKEAAAAAGFKEAHGTLARFREVRHRVRRHRNSSSGGSRASRRHRRGRADRRWGMVGRSKAGRRWDLADSCRLPGGRGGSRRRATRGNRRRPAGGSRGNRRRRARDGNPD